MPVIITLLAVLVGAGIYHMGKQQGAKEEHQSILGEKEIEKINELIEKKLQDRGL
ncbi:MAG: hypothetical protein MJZ81_05320 [Bacteroidales bacterium]|nr:hypothetical protein [Bacteroidales bacterium]